MTDADTWVLGVDVGNAKLKLFALHMNGSWRTYATALPWSGHNPYNRNADFEAGVLEALRPALSDNDSPPACAVAVMSNGYSYPTHHVGAQHTLRILGDALPQTNVHALAWNGELFSASDEDAQFSLLACTNGMGAVHLARRCKAWAGRENGLVMDVGGTTIALTPLVDGHIDPAALAKPEHHLDHRARHGKLAWVGSRTTPLESLAQEMSVGGRSYPVIPRGVTMHEVMALLDLMPAERESRLRMFQDSSKRGRLLRAISDSIGIDAETVSEHEMLKLARDYHACAVQKIADAIKRAVQTAPGCGQQVLIFGLASRALGAPALQAAGISTDSISFAEDHVTQKLSDVASVYGAAHAALELTQGQELSAAFAAESPA